MSVELWARTHVRRVYLYVYACAYACRYAHARSCARACAHGESLRNDRRALALERPRMWTILQ
eukprot:547148-Pyramimonas_sp.AAC.1